MVLDNITYALNLWARRQRDALNEKAKKSIVTPDMYMRVLHWEVILSRNSQELCKVELQEPKFSTRIQIPSRNL